MTPSTSEREPGDASRGNLPSRCGKTESLGLPIKLSPCRPGFSACRALSRIDPYGSHLRQVDHEATITRGITGDVVAPAAHCDQKIVCTCEVDAIDDVANSTTMCDQAGSF